MDDPTNISLWAFLYIRSVGFIPLLGSTLLSASGSAGILPASELDGSDSIANPRSITP
ncbi:MAG TPA: hypothetical protein V6C81_24040 [Planktothrix sp.]